MTKEEKMDTIMDKAGEIGIKPKKVPEISGSKNRRRSDFGELFLKELNDLLEKGIEPTCIWLDDNGGIINMRIAMQDLIDDDPWMLEMFTNEEISQIEEADNAEEGDLVEW